VSEIDNGIWVDFVNETNSEETLQEYTAIIATAIQVGFIGVAIFIFMMGKAKYKMVPPTGMLHIFLPLFIFWRLFPGTNY
jgi:hypothetical protein